MKLKPETTKKVKFAVVSFVCGAIVTMIIGFGWGGWTTASTTRKMTDDAVLVSQAAICVAQFVKQADHEAKLKALGEIDSWKRSEFIEKGGWDRMPGQEKAGSSVAEACAKGLEVLIKR